SVAKGTHFKRSFVCFIGYTLDKRITEGPDSSSLSSLDISDGVSLAINARLLGGKVHGSLARAGKVRALTPKVEKQEKKKKKKGRAARKRIQYTRRFANVATGPGKEAWTQLQCCLICLLLIKKSNISHLEVKPGDHRLDR
ncbi:ribosomal protein S30, partial [Ostertagia ostertagi]